MSRISLFSVIVTGLLLVSAGCQKKPAYVEAQPAAAKPAPTTPEESFETIFETFRRGVEDVPIGFVVQDSSGSRTMMTGRNKVTHKLLPPQKEGDPLRAEIKVTSDMQYSLQRSTQTPESDESEQSDATADETAQSDNPDVEIFDPQVASAPSAAPAKADPGAVTVNQRNNTYERIYVLVYEGGRWKLVTELDLKTEESIKLAFDRALNSQS
jgi:hypothetical protein